MTRTVIAYVKIIFIVEIIFQPSHMINPEDDFSNPEMQEGEEIELELLKKELSSFMLKMQDQLDKEPDEVSNAVQALLNKQFFQNLNTKLNAQFDELTEESEQLIESPDANTSEVQARRKELAEKINTILEIQHKIGGTALKKADTILQSTSREAFERARIVIQSFAKDLRNITDIDPTNN